MVKILLDKGASLTDKVLESDKDNGDHINEYLSMLIDWLID